MNKLNLGTRTGLALISTLLSAATLAGCGEEGKGSKRERCTAAVLESDLELEGWMGPAVDPATKELALEAGKAYVVSSTYGVPRPGSDGAPVTERYLQIFSAVEQQLGREPGLLAMRLGQSERCGSGRTLAVWRSEEEMYDFVTSDAHLQAMKAADELLQPGYEVTHWDAQSTSQMTIDEAVQQLAK
jgi:heme-degrading monooxygenase HmoA